MDDVIKRLESVDTHESSSAVSRLQKRLGNAREAQLLSELVDYFIASGSTRALNVLSSLKDVQSQDFFSKLNDCLNSKNPLCVPVLRLLAHSLNKQTSWLHKIVQHPLFTSILHYLKISHDVLVLTSGLLVLAAILPLAPSHLSHHLPDIFQIFADLATVRTGNRLKLTPKPLYLHLDVGVYYLFLQLYALFPCNFFIFLRGRYGPMGERKEFNQYIAPLFNFVRFHPGLVMDSNTTEIQGDKWRTMEPDEIATLSLTMCLDMSIASPLQDDEGSETGVSIPIPPPVLQNWEPTSLTESLAHNKQLNIIIPPTSTSSNISPLSDSSSVSGTGISTLHSRRASCPMMENPASPSPVKRVSPKNKHNKQHLREQGSIPGRGNGSSSDGPNADRSTGITKGVIPSVDGPSYKDTMWSPSMAFDTSLSGCHANNSSSIPSTDTSATTSIPSTSHHTPRPLTTPTFTYQNYSPTASLSSEQSSRQQSTQTTPRSTVGRRPLSSVHYHDPLEERDPFISGANRLSQSLISTSNTGRYGSGEGVNRSMTPQSLSIKNKFEKFFSLFSSKTPLTVNKTDHEEFVAVTTEDVMDPLTLSGGESLSLDNGEKEPGVKKSESGEGGKVRAVNEEIGVEASEELLLKKTDGNDVTAPDNQDNQSKEREEEEEKEEDDDNSLVTTTSISHSMTHRSSTPKQSVQSASFPGGLHWSERQNEVKRKRASQSDSVAHTVKQVQERLKELADVQNHEGHMSSPQKIEERDGLEEDERECIEETPINQSYMQEHSFPSLTTSSIPTVDSSNTLIGSGSSPGLFSSQYTGTGVSLEANETGASLLHGVPSTSSLLHESRGSGLFMKRVSVCDRSSGRRGVSIETQTSKTEGNLGGGYYSPSPVVLLDQLIQHGEMVHRGNPHDIPLTELEGIDWFRFGSCPHSEELGQMQCQVAMLHSQLLFERHQCLQHDRRNRRLLSKARNAHRVREELEQLRNQCWQESFNVRQSLEHQMEQGVGGEMVGERGEAQRLREENRALLEENKLLQENNHRLTVELCRIQQEKSRLTSEAKEMREKMFVMESELADLKPRLAQTGSLLKKVAVLERELLVYNQMYKNQREESLSLLAHSKAQHEWSQLTKILKEEKEVAERERARFEQETEGLKNVVASLRDEGQRTQEERAVLQQILQHVQGRCQEKIKASEEKYEAMVAVTHQLESHITELRARNFTRKKTTSHRHKRSSSHPAVHRTGSSPTSHTTPSPVTSHTPSFSLDSSI